MEILEKIKKRVTYHNKISHFIGWYGLYKMVTENPNKFENVSKLYLFHHTDKKYRSHLVHQFNLVPEIAAIIHRNEKIQTDFESLKNLPENSLGFIYYHFLKKHKLHPMFDYFKKVDKSSYHYIIYRILATHDIYHVLLNTKPDIKGEGLVVFFTLQQLPSYMPPLIHFITVGLHCALFKQDVVYKGLKHCFAGWQIGQEAKQFFCVNWDDYFHLPIEEVRSKLNIKLPNLEE